MNETSVHLEGSRREGLEGAKMIGDVDPKEKIEVTVYLRPNPSAPKLDAGKVASTSAKSRDHLTRKQFAKMYGALESDAKKVQEFGKKNGLQVEATDLARRSVVLSGTATQFEKAFKVKLKRFQHPTQKGVNYRGREGWISIPSSLSGIVQAVLGRGDRPQVVPHLERLKIRSAKPVAYSVPEVAKMYDYPSNLNGSGQCVAILEFGGGYIQSDLSTYFSKLSLPVPNIMAVSVDGAQNNPGTQPNDYDGEVALDIEVVGSIATRAKLAVYFAPWGDRGIADAISMAAHDSKNAPSVISISWGQPEIAWTSQAISVMNQAIQDAATMGVTVCVASGDSGSSDGVHDHLQHVDFPASSPFALACGGTRLVSTNGTTISQEVVWNDGSKGGATGGGISDVFALPSWQNGFDVPPSANPGHRVGRGVPDVSGDADPETGYAIVVDGESEAIGGTSAVAPLWAGLVALINQNLGHPIGFINPLLYQLYSKKPTDFHDITVGNKGSYSAIPGWDPCTGLGTPDGTKIMNDL